MNKKKPTLKNKKPKAQPTPRPRKALGPSPPKPSIPRSLVSRVCGLTDPFCEHARGAKYPDDSSTRTLAFTSHVRQSFSSDANGYVNVLVCPQVNYLPYTTSSVFVGSAVTSWSNFGASSTPGVPERYRIVSFGFIVRSALAPLSKSGMVHIRGYPNLELFPLTTVDTTTYNCSWSKDVSMASLSNLPVIAGHTSQMPQVFYYASADVAVVANTSVQGYQPITVAVTGAPASAPGTLDIEFFCHYELTFGDSTSMSQLATPPVESAPMLPGVVNKVTRSIGGVVADTVSAVGKNIAKKAVSSIAAAIFGPLAGGATHLAIRDVD